jgi:excisionase family DNA binding protein
MSKETVTRNNSPKTTAATKAPGGTTITSAANDHLADDPHVAIPEEQEVLNAEEVAKILRIHPVTARLKAAAGEIPGKRIGNRWRFSRTRLNEWLKAA